MTKDQKIDKLEDLLDQLASALARLPVMTQQHEDAKFTALEAYHVYCLEGRYE